MKKSLKIGIILILFLIIVNSLSVFVSAEEGYNWEGKAIEMMDKSSEYDSSGASSSAKKVVGAIIVVTRVIATGIAIIMLLVVAIKYMSSAPGERAEIKKHAVTYIVGAIVLFATSGILTIIAEFAINI